MNSRITIKRSSCTLLPDFRRVLAKPYLQSEESTFTGKSRAEMLIKRILGFKETEVAIVLAGVMEHFLSRHKEFKKNLERHFKLVAHLIPPKTTLSRDRRLLIGAYFTHEYSVEAAALFNPSIVLAPDQTRLPRGQQRFVMSLRAVGEGHISSIEFRSGTLDAKSKMTFDPVSPKLVGGRRTPPRYYSKDGFRANLMELGVGNDIAWSVLSRLSNKFTPAELEQSLAFLEMAGHPQAITYETVKIIRILAASRYVATFPSDSNISERVIFPVGPNETRGMEDARFVRFVEDDGSVIYYATYTAYDGFQILPQLIETRDFLSFTILTLSGPAAQNKGMALFPRRIGGKYMMLSRKDRENLYLAISENVRNWNSVAEIHYPSKSWDLLQIGNCGSPIETEAGWLVLTHGVGPMRRYTISAILLDLNDPRRVISRLPIPLLGPNETEREGYVPNVLYSCGGLINGNTLVLPYGASDSRVNIALVSVPELLARLR